MTVPFQRTRFNSFVFDGFVFDGYVFDSFVCDVDVFDIFIPTGSYVGINIFLTVTFLTASVRRVRFKSFVFYGVVLDGYALDGFSLMVAFDGFAINMINTRLCSWRFQCDVFVSAVSLCWFDVWRLCASPWEGERASPSPEVAAPEPIPPAHGLSMSRSCQRYHNTIERYHTIRTTS